MYSKIKDIFTDLLGLAILLGVGYHTVITHRIPFIWEGIVGLAVGAVFFMLPDTGIASALGTLVKKGIKKATGDDSVTPDQPE